MADKNESSKFGEGKIVRLKSGSRPMVTVRVGDAKPSHGPSTMCIWMDETGQLHRELIPNIALEGEQASIS